ncbi:MAG: hypothetical protein ACOCYF_02390 [Bacteroidota bacterium]
MNHRIYHSYKTLAENNGLAMSIIDTIVAVYQTRVEELETEYELLKRNSRDLLDKSQHHAQISNHVTRELKVHLEDSEQKLKEVMKKFDQLEKKIYRMQKRKKITRAVWGTGGLVFGLVLASVLF